VSDEDPGWRPLLWRAPISLIPVFGLLYLRRRRPSDALTEFRFVWLGIVVSLWLFAFVLLFVVPTDRYWKTDRDLWLTFIFLAVALVSLVRLQALRNSNLDVSSLQKLAASYRGKAFIGIGWAESPALAAFIATFFVHALWIYLLGAVVATLELIWVGPTKRELARRQEQISEQGSSLSLLAALLERPPSPGSPT